MCCIEYSEIISVSTAIYELEGRNCIFNFIQYNISDSRISKENTVFINVNTKLTVGSTDIKF